MLILIWFISCVFVEIILMPPSLISQNSYIGVTQPTLKLGPTLDFLLHVKERKRQYKIARLKVMLLQNWEFSYKRSKELH